MTIERVRPKKLYRYFSDSSFAFSNLANRSLYFSSPSGFNDPFDSALWPRIIAPSEIQQNAIAAQLMEMSPRATGLLKVYLDKPVKDWQQRTYQSGDYLLDIARTTFLNQMGVICLTDCPRNLLMWAHYTNRHRGFCLEFDAADPFFTKLKPIHYSEHVPEFLVGDLYLSAPDDLDVQLDKMFQLFCTKSKDWEYENEWRLFDKEVKSNPFPPSMLKAVYLGTRTSRSDTLRLIRIARTWETPLTIYKAHLSRTEFAVDFEKCAS